MFSSFPKINDIVFPLIKLRCYPACFSASTSWLFVEDEYSSTIDISIY
ncbi:hypothetical protein Q7O_002859 [Pectobacterium carotovorum subsp. carotovorum PCCS1]|nr:hypothetical protein [Pectobacterium carotovorum subsp. carotovorum PCCS1]